MFSAALQNRLTALTLGFPFVAGFTLNPAFVLSAGHLHEEQICIGVIAVTQTCCEPVLQSNTEQSEMHVALTSAAVHFCWLTAHL